MKSTTDLRRVVLYGRTSLDVSEGRSVDDQLSSQRKWAASTGRKIVAELRDDGISASRYAGRKKARPDWQVAMELISTGQTDELSVWEISRSTRDRPVWAALIAACIENDVDLAVDGKIHDPADPDDGFMLDLSFSLGVRESAIISKRTRRAVESRAAAGRPHGSLPYGYRRILDPVTGKPVARDRHPDQAPIVEEIARRLLSGEHAEAIARDLNDRGIPTAGGRQWRGGNLTKLAVRPTYAGLRVHNRKVLDDVRASWPALISLDDHYRLVEMHTDPGRDKYRNPTYVKHLGTGIYRCGREECGGPMRVVVQPGRPNRYDCRGCHKVSRYQAPVDELIETLMCRYLARPDVLELLTADDDAPVKEAAAEVRRLRAQLNDVRRRVEAEELTLDDLAYFRARWEPKIRDAEERARPRSLPRAVFDVAGPDAEAKWRALPIADRRALVAAFLDVAILPAGRGKRKFDPNDLRVSWRGAR